MICSQQRLSCDKGLGVTCQFKWGSLLVEEKAGLLLLPGAQIDIE
jgi:hypothetical protein